MYIRTMRFFGLSLLLLQAFLLTKASQNLCPSIEDLQPCGCVSDGTAIRVDCMSVKDVEAVRKALQSVKGIRRVYIDFLRARLSHVPSDLFQGLHVTKISFTNCELGTIGDEGRSALEGLEDIIEEFSIHFSFDEDNELKHLNVSRLRVIEDLEIEGNELTKLGNDWFKDGPTNVKNLYIMTNLIEEIGDRAFASLFKLKSLWLTGNRFKTIQRSMFPEPATYLNSLDLTNNEISSLPENLFTKMPSLKEVILAENAIQLVSESTFKPVWKQLSRLYLESNPLICDDENIDWMFKISRPYVLKGRCVAPKSRKDIDLKRIIDDKQMEDILDD